MTADDELYGDLVHHAYFSTWCLHGKHEQCSADFGVDAMGETFARQPAQCKTCGSPCLCGCHR